MKTKTFRAPDGGEWLVTVRAPGASNAMVVFEGPPGRDRYAWYLNAGPEARDVTARIDKAKLLDSLGDADFARLFRRSIPVSRGIPGHTQSSRSTGENS